VSNQRGAYLDNPVWALRSFPDIAGTLRASVSTVRGSYSILGGGMFVPPRADLKRLGESSRHPKHLPHPVADVPTARGVSNPPTSTWVRVTPMGSRICRTPFRNTYGWAQLQETELSLARFPHPQFNHILVWLGCTTEPQEGSGARENRVGEWNLSRELPMTRTGYSRRTRRWVQQTRFSLPVTTTSKYSA